MKAPSDYKTRFGLYRATLCVLESKPKSWAWWIRNAREYCEREMPDLLPQWDALKEAFTAQTTDDLLETF